jgi:hypothetical protein
MPKADLVQEFDDITRLALPDIRQCFSDDVTDIHRERAKMGFQAFSKATSRMNAISTRATVLLRAALTLGIPATEQREVWKQIAGEDKQQRTKRKRS